MPNFLALQTDDPVVLSLTILVTGLIVVFLVLIVLTAIIKGYGTAIFNIANKEEKTREEPVVAARTAAPVTQAVLHVEAGIPGEVVAAIAAAVYSLDGMSGSAIHSIRRARKASRSAWGMAGIMENTRPF